MTDLELKIIEASQRYYEDGTSELSDAEFDSLIDQLKAENPDSEVLKSLNTGYTIENVSGNKYKHKYGLVGSLDKVRTWSELNKVFKHVPVDVSLKLDGLSIVLYYEHGKLIRALTRGDGTTGIDITDKAKLILSDKLDEDFTGGIRGEILMKSDVFEKFKEIHPEAKNPRNSTAGLVNGKSLEEIHYLNIYVYSIVGDERLSDSGSIQVSQIRSKLKSLFNSSQVVPYKENVVLEETSFLDTMNELKSNWYYLDLPADGLVITQSAHHNDASIEYESCAFKFKSEIKSTTVHGIEWKLGKSKNLVPVLYMEEVQLAGTNVSRATGFNAKYILDNNIGEGSIVNITKSGEIIPYVDSIILSTKASLPDKCPSCGHELIWNGVHLQCPNTECVDFIMQDTLIWMNSLVPEDGLGDTLIEKFLTQLVDGHIIRDFTVESIMECNIKFSENTSQVQQNKFAHMWNELHGTSNIELVDAIKALNIPRLGDITALKLSEYYDDVNVLKDGTYNEEYFSTLKDKIGYANSVSIENNKFKFKRLQYIWERIQIKQQTKSKGKVAITGKLSVKRSDFEKELKLHGWEPGDIKKDTFILITDDPNSQSSKNQKADKLGIQKVTESEFRKLYM